MDSSERIEKLTDAMRYGYVNNLPIFCGTIAFKEIVTELNLKVILDTGRLWGVFIRWKHIEIIRCSQLGDLLVIATDYHNMQPLTPRQHIQE